MPTNATHDPDLKSWVDSANDPATDFPIQNLPLCAFQREHDGPGGHRHRHGHLGARIGDQVLDVTMLAEAGYFADDEEIQGAISLPVWNALGAHPAVRSRLREKLQAFLNVNAPAGQSVRRLRLKALEPAKVLRLDMPIAVFDYTDFYASKHHASNVGSMFRPDNPLLPNYRHVPIGYHGRASSVVVSGTEIRRPRGQQAPKEGEAGARPSFGPSTMLDYELELGLVVGKGNELGEPIPMERVGDAMFGLVLLNDWSARDIQKWEYQPLGPFLAKNFGTTISPSIVTMEALEPFRIPGPERDAGDPEPLEYLRGTEAWGLDITLEVHLETEQMRARGMSPVRLSRSNARHMFWTFAQMVVHHASNGCNLKPGDLIGSGTISGPEKGSRGCMLELTWEGNGPDGKPRARKPIELPSGETRTFLADGDEVIMTAYCAREGFRRIGFGECRGRVVPATAG